MASINNNSTIVQMYQGKWLVPRPPIVSNTNGRMTVAIIPKETAARPVLVNELAEMVFTFDTISLINMYISFDGELSDSEGLEDSRDAEEESELSSVLIHPIITLGLSQTKRNSLKISAAFAHFLLGRSGKRAVEAHTLICKTCAIFAQTGFEM